MDVMDPPYIDPNHTPAIMIKPVSGGNLKVKGSNNVNVAVAPNPGKTPMMVPIRAPIKQAKRFTIEIEFMTP